MPRSKRKTSDLPVDAENHCKRLKIRFPDYSAKKAPHADDTSFNAKRCLAWFVHYTTKDEPDTLGPEAMERFCEDIGVVPEDVTMLVLAYKMSARDMGFFTRSEWLRGLTDLQCDSAYKVNQILDSLREMLKDSCTFKAIYRYAYDFARVKYLGQQPSRGLWGIKHTRKPVDDLVTRAKAMSAERGVPRASLTISREGVSVTALLATSEQPLTTSTPVSSTAAEFPIEHVSYGVQDLVYTRVFSMIVVRDAARDPFECHAFVCSSRAEARRLTYALAAAFHEYSASLKDQEEPPQRPPVPQKRFAIDLRTPEELAGSIEQETDA